MTVRTERVARKALENSLATHAVVRGLISLMIKNKRFTTEEIGDALTFAAMALLERRATGELGAEDALKQVHELASELGLSLDVMK